MLEPHHLLVGLSTIIVLGISAQWLAWRARVPAILLLLAFGALAGPGAQGIWGHKLFDPDALLGDLLNPLVSLSVAVILFEGGLTLNLSELTSVGKVVRNLVTIGAAVTWIIATWTAWIVLRFPWQLSILLGAVLVVTRPTVIGPLMRHVRPVGRVGAALKWEGIVIDPIGAILAVLVFDAVNQGHLRTAAALVALTVAKTAIVGAVVGLGAAGILVLLLRRYWIADYLQNPFTLMLVVAAFTGSEVLQSDSGLLAVTVMGIAMANQRLVPFKHILEFKESLSVLLVSGLFIILSARLDLHQFQQLGWQTPVFIAVLIFVARPAAVYASTFRLGLTGREKLFLSGIAPRGIVAAAVASVFAVRLRAAGYAQADRIVPITFAVIIATVLVYGLMGRRLGVWLRLATGGQSGFLIAGANPLALAIATVLKESGQQVEVADTNAQHISVAKMAGFTAYRQSALSEQMMERSEGTGIGNLLALTPNEEVNTLAAVHFARVFGRSCVYQLAPEERPREGKDKVSHELRGRLLFSAGMTFEKLSKKLASGVVKRTPLTESFGMEQFAQLYGESALPMFLTTDAGECQVVTADHPPLPHAGQTLIAVVDAGAAEAAKAPVPERVAGGDLAASV
jgi:NhaP-type Na+/H+ or K+/H+ antiporter